MPEASYKIFMMRLTTTCYIELNFALRVDLASEFKPGFALHFGICRERESFFSWIHRNDLGECGFRYTNPQISHFRQRIREFSCTEWNLCKFVRFISERRIYFNTFIRVCYSLQFDSRLSSSFDDGKLFIKQTIFIYRVYMIGLCVLGWRPFSTTLSTRSNHLTYIYIHYIEHTHSDKHIHFSDIFDSGWQKPFFTKVLVAFDASLFLSCRQTSTLLFDFKLANISIRYILHESNRIDCK